MSAAKQKRKRPEEDRVPEAEQQPQPERTAAAPPLAPGIDEIPLEESQPGPAVAMESILRIIEHAAAERSVTTPEEMEKLMNELSSEEFERARDKWIASGPRARAQDLAFRAILEAGSDEEAVALARRALKADPECVDALAVLAELTSGDRVEEFLERLKEAVAVGRKALAGEPHDAGGPLWDSLEARPYMRARFRLADALRVVGRYGEAVEHLEALMDLNPDDHQRAREPLLACYLSQGRLDEARELLARFYEDESAVFRWGRLLERLLSDDATGAAAALERARDQNPYVERFITFRRQPPDCKPETYTPGTREEAVHCLYMMGFAWAAHPEAIHWVRSR